MAAAHGCPEWGPLVASSPGRVAGLLCWHQRLPGLMHMIHTIHAHTYDTYNTYTCIHIHTHTYNDLGTSDTYRYIHIHTHTISVRRGFCAAAAAARDSYAQRHLPRSARTGLRTGSSSAHCDWMAHGQCRGAALAPPTRAAPTGAPKRVWKWVPDRGIKWQGCCPWLS